MKYFKKISGILAVIMLFTINGLITPATAEPEETMVLSENLLPNGDFKNGIDFWSHSYEPSSRVAVVTDDSDAPYGLPYVTLQGTNKGGDYPSFSCSREGKWDAGTYLCRYYAKNVGNKAYYHIQPMMEGYNWDSQYDIASSSLTSEWKEYSYTITVGQDHNRINFNTQANNGDGIFYLSNVRIQKIISTDPNYEPTEEPTLAPIPTEVPGSQRDKKFIYIFAGQSNMDGINKADPEDTVVDDRITKMDVRDNQKWLPGIENINSNAANGGGSTSPAKSIAEELLKVVPSDVQIGLVGCASSGTAIEQWDKESTDMFDAEKGQKKNLYNRMLDRIKEAQKVGIVKGVFWHQGEANSGTYYYEQLLTKLINQLRIDSGIRDLPFIAGQLGIDGNPNGRVNKALRMVKYFVPNTNYATSENLVLEDNVHYTAASQREYGKRYARAYLELNPDLTVPESTVEPIDDPSVVPTSEPTVEPTATPIEGPTEAASNAPTDTPASIEPATEEPTIAPTDSTTVAPTDSTSIAPTEEPTDNQNITKPGKVKKLVVKNIKKKAMKVSFKKVSKAKGYKIYYSVNAKFKKSKTRTMTITKTSVKIKKLSKGKKYYVKVRAYKASKGKKVYGAYSAVKRVKIKK